MFTTLKSVICFVHIRMQASECGEKNTSPNHQANETVYFIGIVFELIRKNTV